jgi:hypothetical protein
MKRWASDRVARRKGHTGTPTRLEVVPKVVHTEEAATKDTPRLQALHLEDTDNLEVMVNHSSSRRTDSRRQDIQLVVDIKAMLRSRILVDLQLLVMEVLVLQVHMAGRILASQSGHDGCSLSAVCYM